MSLQRYLTDRFISWKPDPPVPDKRTKRNITLSFSAGPYSFLDNKVIYKVQRKEKFPPWVTVYSGGKTTQTIDNLAPSLPHKFRLKVILKSEAVPILSDLAIKHFGDEAALYHHFEQSEIEAEKLESAVKNIRSPVLTNARKSTLREEYDNYIDKHRENKQWLESGWSDVTWTSTESDGSSAACLCMAVRCGYLKQVQQMLLERPELIAVTNSSSGLTPLATAARRGDVNMVKFLLSAEAVVDQRTTTSQTPLHLAVLAGHTAVANILLENGADFQARDINGLRVEHYSVDSCDVSVVKFVMDRGGQLEAIDSNGWTPLFRAVCQGARAEVVRELTERGSSTEVTDRAGLTLATAARLLKNSHRRSRDSILKLVDSQYQYDKAFANFTRLTKKISSVNTLLGNKL